MRNKEKLSKIAIASMVLAAAAPLTTEAVSNLESNATFLAAGCAGSKHGCAAASSSTTNTATKSSTAYDTDKYTTGTNYDHSKTNGMPVTKTTTQKYETSPATTHYTNESNGSAYGTTTNATNSMNKGMSTSSDDTNAYTNTTTHLNDQNLSYMDPQTSQMNYGAQQASYETYRYQNGNRAYPSTYYTENNDRSGYGNPYYRNEYRNATYEAPTYQYGGRAANTGYSQYNRPVETTSYQQYSNKPVDNAGYTQSYRNESVKYQTYPEANAANQTKTALTESQLKESVTPQTWDTYQKLSAHAKTTALNLASQNPDRNQAVLDASRVDTNQNRPANR